MISLIILFWTVNSLSTQIDPYQRFCMEFPTKNFTLMEFEMYMSGFKEAHNRLQVHPFSTMIIDPNNQTYINMIGLDEFSEEFPIETQGVYQVCLQNLDAHTKIMTYEVYLSNPELEDALTVDYEEIEVEYEKLLLNEMQIYRNQRFQIEKELDILWGLQQFQQKVMLMLKFKGLFLLLLAVIQILIIREYIKIQNSQNVKVGFKNQSN